MTSLSNFIPQTLSHDTLEAWILAVCDFLQFPINKPTLSNKEIAVLASQNEKHAAPYVSCLGPNRTPASV